MSARGTGGRQGRAELRWHNDRASRSRACPPRPARPRRGAQGTQGGGQGRRQDAHGPVATARPAVPRHRAWPFAAWRERYLDHPLVGTLARRLLWTIDGTACRLRRRRAARPLGRPGDARGAPSRLWHPVGPSPSRRCWPGGTGWSGAPVTQPFKQAHREVYLLTDAERRTGTYSNRFAAHVLRQHQFHCPGRRPRLAEQAPPAGRRPLPARRAATCPSGACGPSTGSRATATSTTTTPSECRHVPAAGDRPGAVLPDRRPGAHAHACGGGYAAAGRPCRDRCRWRRSRRWCSAR